MNVVELPAWSELEVELSAEQASAIEREGLADVLASAVTGRYRVRTSSHVGVVIGEDWELRVRPRLDVPRLMFLLSYAADPSGWKRMVTGFEPEADLFSSIASGFAWHTTWAIDRGLLRGYVHYDEQHVALRGRLRFGDQIARAGGLPLPVEVTHDDFTDDILENRMLKTAAMLVLRLPRVPESARRQLQRATAVLENVEPITAWRGVKSPQITRINERYAPALSLAELILASASISEKAGRVQATTFVFDMNRVFEDFVTVAFRQAMRRHGGVVLDQAAPYSLDEAGALRLRPDLSWWSGGRCLAVLDAKYKAIDDGQMRHDDAYQMLAYCIAYGLPRGYLVYARDSGQESRTHVVRNLGRELVVSAIDVEREPEDVLSQVEALAGMVAGCAAIAAAA